MRITIKEASKIMQCSEQALRMMIQLGKIPGACSYGEGKRVAYYITKEAVRNFMKGGFSE